MSGREMRIYRDTLLAFMGHVLENQYGTEALDRLSDWQYEETKRKWSEIATSTGRKDPEFLLQLFNKDALDFDVVRSDEKVLEVKVKKCIHAEIFRKHNAAHIGYKLICRGDEAVTEGYNPKIKLTRPKLLMSGDEMCFYSWKLED